MSVKFVASGRGPARCAPDPDFPQGKLLTPELDKGVPSCRFDLPYPAPECGWYSVECERCGMTVLVTVAGRPDDPIAVVMPCEAKDLRMKKPRVQ